MQRHTTVSFSAAAGLLFAMLAAGAGPIGGCSTPEDSAAAERAARLVACQMDDGTVEPDADLHACDPDKTKKTTICHIPPGNPANMHTICVGNSAVAAHLENHGDGIGPCVKEMPCPPPGTGGASAMGVGGASAPGVGGASGGEVPIVP